MLLDGGYTPKKKEREGMSRYLTRCSRVYWFQFELGYSCTLHLSAIFQKAPFLHLPCKTKKVCAAAIRRGPNKSELAVVPFHIGVDCMTFSKFPQVGGEKVHRRQMHPFPRHLFWSTAAPVERVREREHP